MIKTLLKYGANPNIADNPETGLNTPLHLAVSMNQLATLELFLDLDEPQKPEFDAKNSNGFTVLHIAASKGYFKICEILMENGKLFIEIT